MKALLLSSMDVTASVSATARHMKDIAECLGDIGVDVEFASLSADWERRLAGADMVVTGEYKQIKRIAEMGKRVFFLADLMQDTLLLRLLRYGTFLGACTACEKVILSSEWHRAEFSKKLPQFSGKAVAIGSHFVRKQLTDRPRSQVKALLFMGGYGNASNRKAIELIAHRIAPQLPGITFYIAGDGVPSKKEANVVYEGGISDAEKERLYDLADMCIAPMLESTGRKAKMFDYFEHGKVVLGTRLAFIGYDVSSGRDCVIEDDISAYGKTINGMSADSLMRLQRNVPSILKEVTKDSVLQKWREVVNAG